MTTRADAVRGRIASFHCKTKFADCVIVVGNNKEFPAIKALLAMQSEYFEKMLFNQHFNTSKNLTIATQDHQKKTNDNFNDNLKSTFYETDVSATAFEFIKQYCYGVADANIPKLSEKNVIEIYYAANKYLITPIKDICIEFLDDNVDENNIIPILYDTARHGLKDVETKLLGILQKKVKNMINNPLLLQLPYKWFSEMFTKNNTLSRVGETVIFDICVKYCKNYISNQSNLLTDSNNHLQSVTVHLSLDSEDHDESKDESKNETIKAKSATITTCCDEDEIIKQNFTSWQSMMQSVFIPFINFSFMDTKYLLTTVRKINLLSNEELWKIIEYLSNRQEKTSIITSTPRSGVVSESSTNTTKYPNRYYGRPKLLHYTISMSDLRYLGKKKYDDLISDNFVFGAGTNPSDSPFIQATLDKASIVHSIELAPPAINMNREPWELDEINGAKVEYLRQTAYGRQTWKYLADVDDLEFDEISKIQFDLPVKTKAIRITLDADKRQCLGIGCLRIYGTDT